MSWWRETKPCPYKHAVMPGESSAKAGLAGWVAVGV